MWLPHHWHDSEKLALKSSKMLLALHHNTSKTVFFHRQISKIMKTQARVHWRHSGIRIQHCHCSSPGHYSGTDSIPGLGTSTYLGCNQKLNQTKPNQNPTSLFKKGPTALLSEEECWSIDIRVWGLKEWEWGGVVDRRCVSPKIFTLKPWPPMWGVFGK